MSSPIHTTKYYDVIFALFVSILLLSNIGAIKIIDISGVLTDGGAILFPLAYILGDILTEVYGYSRTRKAIWTGFAILALAVLTFNIVRVLPPADAFEYQNDFENIFGFFPRIVFGSLSAYLVGSFVNSFVLAKLKVKHHGKRMWRRLIGSTLFGQTVDTVIFGFVAFGGLFSNSEMLQFISIGVAFKIGVEILLLPITYRVIAFLKSSEGIDVYDNSTDFNPLKFN